MNARGFLKVVILIVLFAPSMVAAVNTLRRPWVHVATGGIFGLGISIAYCLGRLDPRP